MGISTTATGIRQRSEVSRVSEYTPSVDKARIAYAGGWAPESIVGRNAYAEFDRMIAQVRAEALREAADDLDSNFQDLPGWDRAYRIGIRTRDWEHGALTITGDVIRKLRDRATRVELGEQS